MIIKRKNSKRINININIEGVTSFIQLRKGLHETVVCSWQKGLYIYRAWETGDLNDPREDYATID